MSYKVNDLMYAAGEGILNTIRTDITFTEPVNKEVLESATNAAAERFPYFCVKLLQRGEEYVMEHNSEPFAVSRGSVGAPLGSAQNNHHLFSVTYENDTIYIHTSHFITDGRGIFPFIRTLVYLYLHELHPDEEFDMAHIDLPGSAIPSEEADSDPYPDELLPCAPIIDTKRPRDILKLGDLHEESGSNGYTSFRIAVKQKELMRYLSSVDGSPATFITSVMYKAIAELHRGEELPVVCGMQHQFRNALGKPFSHNCHVNIVPMVYPNRLRDRDIETLNTISRGMLLLRASDENDILTINANIRNRKHIEALDLMKKHRFMRKVLLKGIGSNTFEVSYTGRVYWCGLDKYIKGVAPYIDLSLSGGLSVEIFTVGDIFDINIMQRGSTTRYFDRFCELLTGCGVSFVTQGACRFELCGFVLPEQITYRQHRTTTA